jgi:hypothetical protein
MPAEIFPEGGGFHYRQDGSSLTDYLRIDAIAACTRLKPVWFDLPG